MNGSRATTTTTTSAVPIPIDPPIGKCNYFINKNDTVVVFDLTVRYGGIPQNLLFNLIGWTALVLIFSFLRRAAGNYGRLALFRSNKRDDRKAATPSGWTELFFSPDDVVSSSPLPRASSSSAAEVEEEPDGRWCCAWIASIFTLTDDKFLRKCGPDAVQYLRFQRHLIFLVVVMTVVCISVILPINFQGNLQGDRLDFGHTTISNLVGTDDLLWVHAVVVVVFFPVGVLVMRRFSVGLNLVPDKNHEKASKTLMISGIPSPYCTVELLRRHFLELHPDQPVEEIQPAYDVSELMALDEARERARRARLQCETYAADKGAGRQICPRRCGIVWSKLDDLFCHRCRCRCCCQSVDALTFYIREEKALGIRVELEKAKARTKSIGVAFVTFSSAGDASRVLLDHRSGSGRSGVSNLVEPGGWSLRISPPPDDIYWENLTDVTHRRLFLLKSLLVNAVVFVVLFFFTSPTYILSQLELILNLKSVKSSLGLLPDKINDFLPTLMLWTLSALLPIVVAYSDWWLGHWRRSAENLWIMRKVFFYLLFMVLILPSIGLTTLRALVEFVVHSRPTDRNSTMTWNCIFLPDNGAFFVNYAVTSSLMGTALELLRFSELLSYAWRLCFARSSAETAGIRRANLFEFPFGFNYSWMLLGFALTSAYCVVCPLIAPFGLFYLTMKHAVDRYNLFYVYGRSKISKQIHATAVNCVIVCLLLQQLVLLFFNVIRGRVSATEDGDVVNVLSARAIFSITLFTIFSLTFIGQIFFHAFMGFSPIQYTSAAAAAAAVTTDEEDGGGDASLPQLRLDLQCRQQQHKLYVPEVMRGNIFGRASMPALADATLTTFRSADSPDNDDDDATFQLRSSPAKQRYGSIDVHHPDSTP